MKIIKALRITVTVSLLSLLSCKKETTQTTQLKVVKVELIINDQIVSTSKPVYK